MNQIKILSLLFIFLFPTFSPISANEAFNLNFSKLNKTTPGCAIGVRHNGNWLHEGYYGLANIQYNIPISKNTKFNIASITKHFTAALILVLEYEGKLSRSDSLKKYWTEGPKWANEITLYHLIHHSSGMPDYLSDKRTSNAIIAKILKNQKIIRNMLISMPIPKEFIDNQIRSYFTNLSSLQFNPGTRIIYNNTGYFFLAYIIEKVTGKSIGEFSREKFFIPLEMKNTYFSDATDKTISLSATGYQVISFDNQKFYPLNSLVPTNGDLGVFTTIQDFAKWIDHLNNPVIEPRDVWDNFLILHDSKYGDAVKLGDAKYRNGLSALNQVDDNIIYYHSGKALDGLNTKFFFDLKKRFSYIQFCNFDYESYTKGFDRRWLYSEFGIQYD